MFCHQLQKMTFVKSIMYSDWVSLGPPPNGETGASCTGTTFLLRSEMSGTGWRLLCSSADRRENVLALRRLLIEVMVARGLKPNF